MDRLQLRFLGDFAVLRGGRPQALPPSKKTRALLAYLSLNSRQYRRDYLCELLWEIPDDPRGSLRWSLSKLRRLVDAEDRPRIVADRSNVAMDSDDIEIDVVGLRELSGERLAQTDVEELESAAERYAGNFLEGLEFSDFHDFHTWCVAEREQVLRDRTALLSELVMRLQADPERALPHARTLVGLAPYDERLRARFIKMLNEAGQHNEAEEQYQLGLRMLREVGSVSSGLLQAARHAPRIDRPPPKVAVTKQPDAAAVSDPEAVVPSPAEVSLIGRDAELGEIAARYHRAVSGAGARVVMLRGSAGIGKSAVLEALKAMAVSQGAWVLSAAAFESDSLRPFAIWIDALRAVDPACSDSIFASADIANRDRLFSGLSDKIGQEAAKRPVVFVFDDVHWCDESSAAALHYVVRTQREKPVFGIVAARGGELQDNAPMQQALRGLRRDSLFDEVRLGPLDDDSLGRLIADVAPDSDGARLSRESGGNPLLAIELARAESEGTIGSNLTDLVLERLAQIGAEGADVIGWASVIRPRIDIAALATLTGLDDARVGRSLEAAERYAILVAGNRGLRFSHDLVAQAVYTGISPLRRQVMHRRIAGMLEKDARLDLGKASDLAHHATNSGDSGLAARAMASAGRLCLRFFSNEEAASLARKGLHFAKDLADAERICAEIELHDVLFAAEPIADEEAAAELYECLGEQALDFGQLAHARLGYHMASWVRWEQGKWAAARAQSLQAERAIRGGDDQSHVVGMAETAKCLVMLERDLPQADAMLMEARALADRQRIVHHAIPMGLGMLKYHENRIDEAETLFEEARSLCKSAGDRLNEYLALEYLVMIDLLKAGFGPAKARAELLVDLGEKLRDGSERPFAHALHGLCDYALQDDTAELESALDELRVVDAKYRLAYALTRSALVDCERGRTQQADERAREGLECATILERPTEILIARALLACSCRNRGLTEEAADHERELRRVQPGAAAWTADIMARLATKH